MGHVIGTAGASLARGGSWAAGAGQVAAGARGETATGAVLNELARASEVTVLHDLRIPIPSMRLNIDHAVVAGRCVLLVDSKSWRPGFYWTVGEVTRRGVTVAPHARKQTVAMAHRHIGAWLGPDVALPVPVVAAWPSSRNGTVRVWAASFPGARLVPGHRLARTVRRALDVDRRADPLVVARLQRLVNT